MFESRFQEFETLYIETVQDYNVNQIDAEQELIDAIVKYSPDKNIALEVRIKLHEYENQIFNDYEIYAQRAYKFGFIDGYDMKKEIKSIIKQISKASNTNGGN